MILLPAINPEPDPEPAAALRARFRTVSASLDPWELPEISLDEGIPWKGPPPALPFLPTRQR